MAAKQVYNILCERKREGRKSFGLLIDPDKADDEKLANLLSIAIDASVDFFLVGGSLVISDNLDHCIKIVKRHCSIPVLLFPGNSSQVSPFADALLYLSLISGRNPDLLIGQHVVSAPAVRKSGLEIISTGYMVIDGGAPTTVSYISNASPLPADKPEIAMCTAMAGEMLGMKLIYMDAGSGARTPIREEMIERVSRNIDVPLIVGGGIKDPEKAYLNCKSGADMIIIGNAIEKDFSLVREMSSAIHSVSLVD